MTSCQKLNLTNSHLPTDFWQNVLPGAVCKRREKKLVKSHAHWCEPLNVLAFAQLLSDLNCQEPRDVHCRAQLCIGGAWECTPLRGCVHCSAWNTRVSAPSSQTESVPEFVSEPLLSAEKLSFETYMSRLGFKRIDVPLNTKIKACISFSFQGSYFLVNLPCISIWWEFCHLVSLERGRTINR